MKPTTATGRINAKALDLLAKHPEGMRWVDLAAEIKRSDTSLHPKTINGGIWRLVESFPDTIYKPSKGLFRLLKYKTINEELDLVAHKTSPINVEEYIANIPTAARPVFDQLRGLVQKQLPTAKEVLSYGVIGYKIDDKRARVFISGWKDHVAMYPIPQSEPLRSKLKPYIKGKGALCFPLDKPLPGHIIQESARELVA